MAASLIRPHFRIKENLSQPVGIRNVSLFADFLILFAIIRVKYHHTEFKEKVFFFFYHTKFNSEEF